MKQVNFYNVIIPNTYITQWKGHYIGYNVTDYCMKYIINHVKYDALRICSQTEFQMEQALQGVVDGIESELMNEKD